MEIVQNRTGRDWIIAVRPWSFTTSSVAVLVTVAYLFYINCAGAVNGNIDWLNASLCLPLLMILHAGGNLVSDYYDYIKGIDGPIVLTALPGYVPGCSNQRRYFITVGLCLP